MSRFLRVKASFRSILVFQVVAIAALSSLAAFWMASAVGRNNEQVDAIDTLERRIRSSVRGFLMGANDFVATGDAVDRSASDRGLATARASLLALSDLVPGSGARESDLDGALERAEGAVEKVWTATAGAPRILAMRRFDQAVEAVYGEIERAEGAIRANTRTELNREFLGLGALWLSALALYAATGWLARRRQVRDEADAEAARTEAVGAATAALHAALADGASGAVPVHPLTRELAAAVASTADTFDRLRETIAKERRRTSFSANLMEALDLADDEREAVDILRKAGQIAFPDGDTQLLLADNSHSALLPTLAGPCACAPGSPQTCPAARKGRILQHTPDGELARCPRLTNDVAHVACAPVTVAGRTVGALQIAGPRLEPGRLELLGTVATSLGARLGVVRTLAQREVQAQTDVLTGLRNRRAMNEELERLDREGQSYAILAADLDHFKRLNDTYGHEIGDRCLRIFAQVLRDACRSADLPCRPGGEEFTVVLPAVGVDAGLAVAERIRDLTDEVSRSGGIGFTVSIGVAARPEHGAVAEDVLRAADAALYEAKEAGRNRVACGARREAQPALM